MKMQRRTRPGRQPRNVEVIPNLVGTTYLRRLFRLSRTAIGVSREFRGLPYVEICGDDTDKQPIHRYNIGKVLAWAHHNRVRIYLV